MKNNEHNSTIDPTYMNLVPPKARVVAKMLLRDYLLNELVQLQERRKKPKEFSHLKLSDKDWLTTLNHVILTKLSSFKIHNLLTERQLKKLIEITANCLESENKTINDLIDNLDEDAHLLKNWLHLINQQLKLKVIPKTKFD